jgi:hypothetical protein
MSDAYTRERFAWLDQVLADHALPEHAFRVAYAIATHFLNRRTRDAWPGLKAIANAVGRSTRRVQDSVKALVAAGHMIAKRGGDGRSSRYRLVLADRTEASAQSADRQDETVRSEEDRPDDNVRSDEIQTGHFRHSDRTLLAFRPDDSGEQTGQKCPPNPLREPIEEPLDELIERPRPRNTATLLPDNWQPSSNDIAFAQREGLAGC